MIASLTDLWHKVGARRFTDVVPLGLSCRVTYQVRRYFGGTVAYPFDWWLSPLGGLARYLEVCDPARIYSAQGLREVIEDGRAIALESVEFGVQPFHEFARHRQDGVSVIRPGWQEQVAAAGERHAARLERLLALDRPGRRVLFVRHRFDADRARAPEQAAIDALARALERQFSRCEHQLLLIGLQGLRPARSAGVLSLEIDDLPAAAPEEWQGADAGWDRGFRALRIRALAARTLEAPPGWLTPSGD